MVHIGKVEENYRNMRISFDSTVHSFGSKGKWRRISFDPSFKGKMQEFYNPVEPRFRISTHEVLDMSL